MATTRRNTQCKSSTQKKKKSFKCTHKKTHPVSSTFKNKPRGGQSTPKFRCKIEYTYTYDQGVTEGGKEKIDSLVSVENNQIHIERIKTGKSFYFDSLSTRQYYLPKISKTFLNKLNKISLNILPAAKYEQDLEKARDEKQKALESEIANEKANKEVVAQLRATLVVNKNVLVLKGFSIQNYKAAETLTYMEMEDLVSLTFQNSTDDLTNFKKAIKSASNDMIAEITEEKDKQKTKFVESNVNRIKNINTLFFIKICAFEAIEQILEFERLCNKLKNCKSLEMFSELYQENRKTDRLLGLSDTIEWMIQEGMINKPLNIQKEIKEKREALDSFLQLSLLPCCDSFCKKLTTLLEKDTDKTLKDTRNALCNYVIKILQYGDDIEKLRKHALELRSVNRSIHRHEADETPIHRREAINIVRLRLNKLVSMMYDKIRESIVETFKGLVKKSQEYEKQIKDKEEEIAKKDLELQVIKKTLRAKWWEINEGQEGKEKSGKTGKI